MTSDKQQQAEYNFKQGDYLEALKQYQSLSEEEVNVSRWHYKIALCLQHLNDYPGAIRAIVKAQEHDKKNALYYCFQGALLNHQGQHKKAIPCFKSALRYKPKDPAILLSIGLSHYYLSQHDQALTQFNHIINIDPTYAQAYYHAALVHCQQNTLPAAQELLLHCINLDEKHERALGQLGEIALQQSQYKKACDYFSKRLLINKHHAESWHSLGQAELKRGLIEEAITSLEHCLAEEHQHPQAHHDLANALVHQGDHPKALSHYFRQIEVSPLPETFYNIGVLLMYQEHNKDAILYLEKALEMKPDNVSGHINLANIYLKQEQYEQAQSHYESALDFDPDNQEIQHILAALHETNTSLRAPGIYLTHLFDQYAPYYDKHLTEHLRYQAPKALIHLIQEQCQHSNPQWTILDLGCGTGLVGEHVKPLAKKLTGIDISPEMIAAAKQKNLYDALYTDDIDTLLPTMEMSNLIIAADVLSYYGELTPVFQLCYNNLSEDGLFTFTVEKGSSPDYLLQKTLRYCHSQSYIESALDDAGFMLLDLDNIILREQRRKPVHGFAVIAKKTNKTR